METTNNLKEKANKIMKKLLDVSLYVLGIVAAFVVGFYANQLTEYQESKSGKFSNPIEAANISVAVTEHNELLIIDRNKQSIDVYSDTIGVSIFKAYATRIAEVQNEK
jgi:hypothetical protein